ncbi:bifunctional diaminohydroxyphosphoribosylaminopyrimidine deaminase/5-amino-6-(5-phosphoribosylamino)uracil reductase RibD [Georgenia ruanii]|uniref:Riboflavin biosynthesis protein RibD n=1 Tax=Georgenia ruanii TaxID=348442 RepID=A0A7J9UVS0_9MICO|nr:bifunctional diaminohydroxyphosphoribosylaminopyrimidine deaminase/5-amino-6-(5-phosphoribosylamino)uracil reductase RibD [Georgenia ruanii]MPV88698.1 bifunctional diaminohydroxyphosphoribosylaminopyrimidine deaminase/5-amino-6-(5-phosphoribosylamino)uracil reductase RibD [Georgenia ruanii]
MERRLLDAALARALDLAEHGPLAGGNPRVGCVILDTAGGPLAEGWHRGAGTAHAEAAALAAVPAASRHRLTGAVAVVTLEPCRHTGHTPPCAAALDEAGVAAVIYAVADPHPVAAGGAAWLAAHGVTTLDAARAGLDPALVDRAHELLHPWTTAVRRGRPWLIGKTATSLDGRVAAADGTSRWITGPDARAHAHVVRAGVDAIVVGTGTVLADDPALTARGPDGRPAPHQPVRVVIGHRDVPDTARVRSGPGEWLHLRTHDLGAVLAELDRRGLRRVLLEGGPALLSAALRRGLVDELHAYVAPVLLGAGPGAVGDLGITTIADAARWRTRRTEQLGPDLLLVATAARPTTPGDPTTNRRATAPADPTTSRRATARARTATSPHPTTQGAA